CDPLALVDGFTPVEDNIDNLHSSREEDGTSETMDPQDLLGLIIANLRDELRKLKGKAIVVNAVTSHIIAPKMLTIDVEPIAPKLLNNKTVHSDYLRHTQEEAVILREVMEQGKS
nr:hypothetical protein [Tanacetum cinerariifolium]